MIERPPQGYAPPQTHPRPADIATLLSRARQLAGQSLAELAADHNWPIADLSRAKGWTGQLMEACLGAHGGAEAQPDFPDLGVELKTIPVDAAGHPLESTYVCVVPMQGTAPTAWRDSWVYHKLSTVLWIPVMAEPGSTPSRRLVGAPLLWRMPEDDEAVLRADWEELMELVTLGRYDQLSARMGDYLQIRPKAADARARRNAVGTDGAPIRTNPRGFYLRTLFTRRLLLNHYLNVV